MLTQKNGIYRGKELKKIWHEKFLHFREKCVNNKINLNNNTSQIQL